jgi:hypothetical protein
MRRRASLYMQRSGCLAAMLAIRRQLSIARTPESFVVLMAVKAPQDPVACLFQWPCQMGDVVTLRMVVSGVPGWMAPPKDKR